MLALFCKDEFKTVLLNSKMDKKMIERTIRSLGLNPSECDVIEYDHDFAPNVPVMFDEDKKLQIISVSKEEVKVGEDKDRSAIMEVKTVATVELEKDIIEVHYEKGEVNP